MTAIKTPDLSTRKLKTEKVLFNKLITILQTHYRIPQGESQGNLLQKQSMWGTGVRQANYVHIYIQIHVHIDPWRQANILMADWRVDESFAIANLINRSSWFWEYLVSGIGIALHLVEAFKTVFRRNRLCNDILVPFHSVMNRYTV
jgi:hypothetical protein